MCVKGDVASVYQQLFMKACPILVLPLGGCRGCCDNWLRTHVASGPSGSCAGRFCFCTASGAYKNHRRMGCVQARAIRMGSVQPGAISGKWPRKSSLPEGKGCVADRGRAGFRGQLHLSSSSHTLGKQAEVAV